MAIEVTLPIAFAAAVSCLLKLLVFDEGKTLCLVLF
jgi:hypothetical protein